MGKGTEHKTNDLLDTQRRQSDRAYGRVLPENERRSNEQYSDAQSQIPGLRGQYQNYADTGGIPDSEIDQFRSSFGGGGAGGGSSVANSLASGGGIDESKFGGALAGYQEFASGGGGVDAEGIRARSNRVIPSFYKNMANEAERRKLVNPYAPSFDAEAASRARQAGQQTQENVRDTETGISELISKNRQFGIAGLGDLNSRIQGMVQQGKIAGGQQQISNAGLAESAAGRRQAGEESILNRRQQGRMAGLSGLESQYQTANQNAGQYQDRVLAGTTAHNNAQLQNIQSRQNYTPWWQRALAGAGKGAINAATGGTARA